MKLKVDSKLNCDFKFNHTLWKLPKYSTLYVIVHANWFQFHPKQENILLTFPMYCKTSVKYRNYVSPISTFEHVYL